MSKTVDTTIIGGGMIVNDLILPSLYHLQRTGVVRDIRICARRSASLKTLKANDELRQAFPGQDFRAYPDVAEPADKVHPDIVLRALDDTAPRQAVVVAVPDQFHFEVVKTALARDQHVLCVKPLVLTYREAAELEREARDRGLFIGIEYHKRFDRRALIARRQYGLGHFGEFVMGEAKMIEPYFYRHSNFQEWFTCDQTDPFVYVGCHYVDLVQFITGLKPVDVSVSGVKGTFPNGNEGYMWAHGRVTYENGAILSVIDGLGYPDDGAGSNDQCLVMFCEGPGKSALIRHNDQFRGVTHSYLEDIGCAGSRFNYINPDFYRLVPWEGAGSKPIGYGFDSIAATIHTIHRIENAVDGMGASDSLAHRQRIIREVDEKNLIATPANSYFNELVSEAGRLSILNDSRTARITYGDPPHVALV